MTESENVERWMGQKQCYDVQELQKAQSEQKTIRGLKETKQKNKYYSYLQEKMSQSVCLARISTTTEVKGSTKVKRPIAERKMHQMIQLK